ncbi:hypothetical protein JCM10207_004304 [Rhodosporidiobolus poonsookiae]
MQSTRGRSVLVDPTGRDRFLVGGGAELRLYERSKTSSSSSSTSSSFHPTSVITELTGLRAFAWSPHAPSVLVAAGLATGRVLLLSLEGQDGGKTVPPAVQINVRHSRPCNVVSFAPEHPGLLAVGLEKGRGESLLVYDVQRSLDPSAERAAPSSTRAFSLSREHSQSGRGRAHSPATSSSASAFDLVPLISFGSSEAVTSCAFLTSPVGPSASNTSPLLAAAMAGKWLRVYDLRSPPSTVLTWGHRAVYGVSANPFNAQQFSSHGDDGVVRLWDLRKPMDPLLSFSEVDAGSISARKARGNVVAKPLAETAWSPDKRGVFATLEKDSSSLRVWQLLDGPGPKLVNGMMPSATSRFDGRSPSLPGSPAGRSAEARANQEVDTKDVLRMPIVLDDRQTRAFSHPLTSFTFAPQSHASTLQFVGVSRESAHPGSSGHRLELLDLPADPQVGFLERGVVLSTSAPTPIVTHSIPFAPIENVDEPEAADLALVASPAPPHAQLPSSPPERGRALSLAGLPPLVIDRNKTPRPSGMLRRISSGAVALAPDVSFDVAGSTSTSSLRTLGSDMSVVLRERIEAGYGSDAAVNASLSEGSVSEFWKWIARAQSLSADACFADYDFRFRGVLRILLGFPSGMTNPSLHTPSSTPRTTPPNHSPRVSTTRSIYSDITRSLRRGDEAAGKSAAYANACTQLVARRKLDSTFAISSSAYAPQRKIALQSCGAEWEEEWESVCTRLQKQGDHEGAARHAFFSGRLEKAMNYLRLCQDENLRMLAPIIAAYLAQKDSLQSSDSNFASLCRSLSSDIEAPWVRAMFAFCATSDWRELVDETGLPLKDRVAVALRFLSDSELIPFLTDLCEEALASCDLEAVVLFGLRNDGLKLLSSYVDRTSDVQTVALACSFTSPGLIRADLRVSRWVETYRAQLDQLQLYAARALFDAARGRRARAALEQAKIAGRNGEAKEVAEALRRAAPPQILVRCQFCSATISPAGNKAQGLGMNAADLRSVAGSASTRSTVCPSCSKQLPACCICLARPSIHAFEADGPSTLCWCQKCRHGGHVEHILAWFETSDVCAVAGCDCECTSERRA